MQLKLACSSMLNRHKNAASPILVVILGLLVRPHTVLKLLMLLCQ
jgi:hypothetical protein